ncbi:MAG: CBS domain-containing protein [Betaproteobacteria bacterium]|jgi:CBS domain-containing protein
MKTVKQLVEEKSHKLLSIAPSMSVFEALQKMAEFDVGALVILDEGRLVGIFSERDYARKLILHGKSSKETRVEEIMTTRVVCIGPDRSAEECMALMTDKRVRHLPVLEDKKVVAVISIGDVVREMIEDQKHTIEQLEQYIMS